MIKIILGFVVLVAITFYLLTKPGANIDMGGEKHGIETEHPAASGPAPAASAPTAAASAPVAPASAPPAAKH